MCRDRRRLIDDMILESDTAGILAGHIAMMEGFEPRSKEWAQRSAEIYFDARDLIATGTRTEIAAYVESAA